MVRVQTTSYSIFSLLSASYFLCRSLYWLQIQVLNKRQLEKVIACLVCVQFGLFSCHGGACFKVWWMALVFLFSQSPFNMVWLGDKEGLCLLCPASSALVLGCAAPFAGRRVSPFLKTAKCSEEGELQGWAGTGQPARMELAVLPKLCGIRKPWRIQALQVKKGKTSSRVWRRFCGISYSLGSLCWTASWPEGKISHGKNALGRRNRETVYKSLNQHFVLANSLIFEKEFRAAASVQTKCFI